MPSVTGPEQTLAALYHAFNRRDLDAVLTRMHPEVDWPNAWEGGRVHGRDAVRAYWERQFEEVSSIVEPVGFETREGGGVVVVGVHQVVHDPRTGDLLSDSQVRHTYRFEGGLITRMDVEED
jgi:ketosteroid isomerase-like protein